MADKIVGIDVCEVRGLISDLFEKLCGESPREWLEAFKLFLKKQNPWPIVVETAKTTVETVAKVMSRLSEMIALGRYDDVNQNVNEVDFPPESLVLGSEPKIYHFDRYISSRDVIVLMNADGYRPAKLGDLLDYGAKNPEEQRKYPIIALGSVAGINGSLGVVLLDGNDRKRELSLRWSGNMWPRYYRFLAVRK